MLNLTIIYTQSGAIKKEHLKKWSKLLFFKIVHIYKKISLVVVTLLPTSI